MVLYIVSLLVRHGIRPIYLKIEKYTYVCDIDPIPD